MNQHIRYRPHIDGLRAIAVLGVVLYHFGATWLPGGFLGVDMFFVISGFLISRSIYRDVENGEFSITAFYERRARRILPAFMAVTALTAMFSAWLMLPSALADFAKSAIASTLFSSNIFFYLTSDYFAPSAIELPLLHYWSLGVEEQFYLLFPLIILVTNRFAKTWTGVVVLLLFLASLVGCIAVRGIDPPAAFYLLPFRAFEILIGCLLALRKFPFPSRPAVAFTCSATGLFLCLASFFALSEEMALPGILSLLPCVGAALIIIGSEKTVAAPARFLSAPPVLFIGRISYSLYLVHWPVAVFMNMVDPDMSPATRLALGCSLSLGLSYLSFALVERPTRKSGAIGPLNIPSFFSVSVAFTLVIAAATISASGWPQRLKPDVAKILEYNGYDYADLMRSGVCFIEPENSVEDFDKTKCVPITGKRILLWGDSSMAQYDYGLEPIMNKNGVAVGQITSSGCLPLENTGSPARPNCLPFNSLALRLVMETTPDAVVLGGVWSTKSYELAALEKTIATLEKAGIKIFLIGPPAYYKERIPVVLAKRKFTGDDTKFAASALRDDVTIGRDAIMKRLAARYPSLTYISTADQICRGECKLIDDDGVPLYFDNMHMTKEGSAYYGKYLASEILREMQ